MARSWLVSVGIGSILASGCNGCKDVPSSSPIDIAQIVDLPEQDLGAEDLSASVEDLAAEDLSASVDDLAIGGQVDQASADLRTLDDLSSSVACGPFICGSSDYCNGYTPCAMTSWDPCRPQFCSPVGATCVPLPSLPDHTPCDDNNSCSHVYAASGGCPSNKCIGGANDGSACSSDAQCPGGYCFMNRCIDGPNTGSACVTNADCTGGASADCVLKVGLKSYCNGGSEKGHFCRSKCVVGGGQCAQNPDSYCPPQCVGGSNAGATPCVNVCTGGTCTGAVCVGGTQAGKTCCPGGICHRTCQGVPNSPDCPPAGRCARWAPDPGTGTCKATTDNPFCNTVADCPTTKYCAGDPGNILGSSVVACVFNAVADDCCLGGTSHGPCLVWDSCDTNNHVCVRTTQGGQTATCGLVTALKYGNVGCLGGPYGSGGIPDGGVCNNICLSGVCTSTSGSCL